MSKVDEYITEVNLVIRSPKHCGMLKGIHYFGSRLWFGILIAAWGISFIGFVYFLERILAS